MTDPDAPQKQSELCRKLAQQLREMSKSQRLKSREADILRQAEEWERLAQVAEAEETAGKA